MQKTTGPGAAEKPPSNLQTSLPFDQLWWKMFQFTEIIKQLLLDAVNVISDKGFSLAYGDGIFSSSIDFCVGDQTCVLAFCN